MLYPYLVSASYPDALSTATQAPRRIGHGISVALVSPAGPPGAEVVGAVPAARLQADGIDLGTAYDHADRNLSQALTDGQIHMEVFDRGPAGTPTVVISGHWLAATTLIVSQLHSKMSRILGDDVVGAIPHRDLLFLFGAAASAGMAATIDAEYRSAAKPLTAGLFSLSRNGLTPIT